MNNRLYPHLYLHLKNIFTLKFSTFPNLLMGKPGLICYIKNVKKTPKEKNLRKGPASVLKNSFWDSFQFLFVQFNYLVSP